ncbi:Hypothetical_protein [Hexamita inflata]|uniref:Hypothetical_protein n=1 Tax=Hexamita inflata TaxID=28002 RepID=A0AA86QSM5_9EUKA|nr:Hypothetical protein HINF_LOCUS44935 [Hexamita inflata]
MMSRFQGVRVEHNVDCSLKFHVCEVVIFVQNLCCKRIHVSNQSCVVLLFVMLFELNEQILVLQLLSVDFLCSFKVSAGQYTVETVSVQRCRHNVDEILNCYLSFLPHEVFI